MAALRELGPSVLHRRSWRLPGVGELLVDEDDAASSSPSSTGGLTVARGVARPGCTHGG